MIKDFKLVNDKGEKVSTDGYYHINMSVYNNNKQTTTTFNNIKVNYLEIEGVKQSLSYSDFSNGTYKVDNAYIA